MKKGSAVDNLVEFQVDATAQDQGPFFELVSRRIANQTVAKVVVIFHCLIANFNRPWWSWRLLHLATRAKGQKTGDESDLFHGMHPTMRSAGHELESQKLRQSLRRREL